MKSPDSSEASPRMTYYIVGQALIQSDVEGSLNSPPRHPIVNVNDGKSVIFGGHFAITLENGYNIEHYEKIVWSRPMLFIDSVQENCIARSCIHNYDGYFAICHLGEHKHKP